jgi:hypothetical protein
MDLTDEAIEIIKWDFYLTVIYIIIGLILGYTNPKYDKSYNPPRKKFNFLYFLVSIACGILFEVFFNFLTVNS